MKQTENYKVNPSGSGGWWYKKGEQLEKHFCKNIAPKYGIDAKINPSKDDNPFVPDLIINDDILAEFKHKETPFFTCSLHGDFEPRTTITLDKQSIDYYRKQYRDLYIFIYVNWQTLTWSNIKIDPLIGLWGTTTKSLEYLIENDYSHLHLQKNRRMMNDGTKHVYIFSLDHFYYFDPKKMR